MELYGCNYTDGLVSYSVGGEPYKRLVGVDENVGAGVGETVGVGEGLLFDGRVGGAEDPPTPLLHQGVEGLEPAPDTPVVMIFNFDVMRRFKALYLYLITSQPGPKPRIEACVKFGSNTSTFDSTPSPPAYTFPSKVLLPPGPHNLTLDLHLRPATSLLLEVDVIGLEVDILEVYFESSPCGCKLGEWEKNTPTSPEEHTLSRPPPHPPTDDVWAVYTAHQHRAYVGVAVGFSVGAGVLILVWAGLWVPSVTGPWLTCVYRHDPPTTTPTTPPITPPITPTPTPTLLSPGRITRTDLLASGAFATLSVCVLCDEGEEEEGHLDQHTMRSSQQAALISVSAHKVAPPATRQAQLLCSLCHENVCGLVGVLVGGPVVGVTVSELVGLVRGVAAGMAYLESRHVTHTDLAARNVLVVGGVVKVTQVGSALPRYSSDYWRPPDGRGPAPLRWCSPEALCQGEFSSSSDVWSFGVVVWEILTLARRQPHHHLSDDLLFHALVTTFRHITTTTTTTNTLHHPASTTAPQHTYATPQLVLPAPAWCPREVEEVMTSCWRPHPTQRPTFASVFASLSRTPALC
ncbi:hypothetical protein Pmani_031403 [Petrolisthes manimaculis]|uniref:Protein kinase domain-containing protein n=1 Tax=Petrolisthes manimaculis TaxID=1843537 RepID=A0AAE1NTT6_9EUCA|nr:hypothetical protein Pmani_031403 [Petrolisthes manimaculis]